jgi:hypothetical protein
MEISTRYLIKTDAHISQTRDPDVTRITQTYDLRVKRTTSAESAELDNWISSDNPTETRLQPFSAITGNRFNTDAISPESQKNLKTGKFCLEKLSLHRDKKIFGAG